MFIIFIIKNITDSPYLIVKPASGARCSACNSYEVKRMIEFLKRIFCIHRYKAPREFFMNERGFYTRLKCEKCGRIIEVYSERIKHGAKVC